MIPMADALNHSSVDVTNELINHKIHIEGHLAPQYFRINKMCHNYYVLWKKIGMFDGISIDE